MRNIVCFHEVFIVHVCVHMPVVHLSVWTNCA